MKKVRVFLVAGLLAGATGNANADEVKQYWDRFFFEIKQCVVDGVKSDTTYKPIQELKNQSDIRVYLRSLNYKNYVVYIDTKNITENDVCFLRYLLKTKGYSPVFYKSAELLVVSDFSRQVDADSLKDFLNSVIKDVAFVLNVY